MKLTKILGIICVVALLTGVVSADGWKAQEKNKNIFERQIVLTNKYIDTTQDDIYRIDYYVPNNNEYGTSFPVTEEQFNSAVVGEEYYYKLTNWMSNQKCTIKLTHL